MEEMVGMIFVENEHVVKVNEFEWEGKKQGIHDALECLGSVFEAKMHEVKFEKVA